MPQETTLAADRLALLPVGAADLPALTALARAYYAYDRHDWVEATQLQALRQLCAGTPHARAFFIALEGRRIGYVSVAFGFSIEVGGLDFFLDEFFLEEAWRGRGLGRRALALIEAEVRALGGLRLCLEAELHNARAQGLYESSGYEPHERHLLSKRL